MRRFAGLILLVTLMFQLTGAAGFDATIMNPQSQIHSAHIGTGTANLNCDTCHGFPAHPVQVQNGSGPGQYIVCEQCHAAPPDSFKPSMGNLIVIHLSRNTNCTGCHNTDNITPTHPSTKPENGTLQVIKCENCHANPQQFTSHVNGGKYCLNCHGNKTTTLASTPVPTVTVSTYLPPTVAVKMFVKIDYYRGFIPITQSVRASDEVIWINEGVDSVTLISADGLFEPKLLDSGKQVSYIFNRPGTYGFYLKEHKNVTGNIIVESTPTLISAPTSIPVSTMPVSTYTSPTVKQRAHLQVTYEVGAGRTKQELTISVNLKNTGNATASRINLTIDNPPELQAAALSGSEKIGEIIAWRGELKPGEEHVAQYSVKITTRKDLEVPLRVTYAKISPDEKAKALGIMSASANAEQLLTPEDIEVITLIMKIALSAIPGFEIVLTITALSAVFIFRRR